jgi:polyisoprenoid-binding protein YceI
MPHPRKIIGHAQLKCMRGILVCVALLSGWSAAVVEAAPRRIQFGPPTSEVAIRAYGMGLMPIDARFTRFAGSLTYDPDDHVSCRVELQVEVASLVAEDPSRRDTIVGPDFLDVARFPSLSYSGGCQSAGDLAGELAMHGVTRAFALSLAWEHETVVAEGRLVRADWGMAAMPLLGGRTVRIRVSVPLADGNQPQASHRASAP